MVVIFPRGGSAGPRTADGWRSPPGAALRRSTPVSIRISSSVTAQTRPAARTCRRQSPLFPALTMLVGSQSMSPLPVSTLAIPSQTEPSE